MRHAVYKYFLSKGRFGPRDHKKILKIVKPRLENYRYPPEKRSNPREGNKWVKYKKWLERLDEADLKEIIESKPGRPAYLPESKYAKAQALLPPEDRRPWATPESDVTGATPPPSKKRKTVPSVTETPTAQPATSAEDSLKKMKAGELCEKYGHTLDQHLAAMSVGTFEATLVSQPGLLLEMQYDPTDIDAILNAISEERAEIKANGEFPLQTWNQFGIRGIRGIR